MPSLLSWIAPSDAEGPWSGGIRRLSCEVKTVGAGVLALVLAEQRGSGIYLSPLTPPRCGEALVDGGAARLEDVEPHHRPAEGLGVIVDVEGQSAVAPPPLGLAGALAAGPSLAAAAIEDHLDRGISGEGPLRILVELVPVAGNDQELLGHLTGVGDPR